MGSPSSQNDQGLVREELVAYLDGELAPVDCDRIEKRLAEDEAYLQELQGLDAAWNALDELPTATVDQSFTRTTIAMVAAQAQQDVTQQTAMLPRMRRRHKGLIALACCAAIVTGFFAAKLLSRDSDISLIADLPVIQLVDVYSQVPDVDFLIALGREFESEQLDDLRSANQKELASLSLLDSESPMDRRRRIVGMSEEDRVALLSKRNRFVAQSTDAQRQQMRDLHDAIQNAENKDELQALLLAYRAWLGKRNPGELAELRQETTSGRLELIHKYSMADNRTLSDKELAALRKEILVFHDEKREEIAERLRRRFGRRADIMMRLKPNALAPVVARFLLSSQENHEFLERLSNVLDEDTRQRLQNKRPDQRARLMLAWLRHAFPNEVTPADLEAYFVNELSNNEREKLLAMPWHEMEEELTRRFQAEMMGGQTGATPRDSFRERRLEHRRGQRPHGRFRDGPPRGGPPNGREPGRPDPRRPRPGFGDNPPRPESI